MGIDEEEMAMIKCQVSPSCTTLIQSLNSQSATDIPHTESGSCYSPSTVGSCHEPHWVVSHVTPHHASVTHFRPILGNIVEVTLVTSLKHVYNSHTKETYFP